MVQLSTMLVSVSDLPHYLSLLVIVLLFFGTALFVIKYMTIFWIHGDNFWLRNGVSGSQHRIPQMTMMRVHIPFTFKIVESAKTSFNDIQFLVSSQTSYRLEAFWGVDVRELHTFLWNSWKFIEAAAENGTLLDGSFQKIGLGYRSAGHSERVVSQGVKEEDLDLGAPPRLFYPLVIFLIRDTKAVLEPDETVALVNVIHIQDSVCTLSTGILAQYLKQANGQLSCLKQLYLASGNAMSYETGFEPVEQLCVVCQYLPLSRALLPCRHTCICASCFSKVEACPMCRSPINSYFCIRREDYNLPEFESPDFSHPVTEPVSQWFQDRITDFLGFQR